MGHYGIANVTKRVSFGGFTYYYLNFTGKTDLVKAILFYPGDQGCFIKSNNPARLDKLNNRPVPIFIRFVFLKYKL